jgi:hypothetical protein
VQAEPVGQIPSAEQSREHLPDVQYPKAQSASVVHEPPTSRFPWASVQMSMRVFDTAPIPVHALPNAHPPA